MTPEAKVRNPCVAYAKGAGVLHKRMHFGRGAAAGWPDDLFVFPDGHHWWAEFKRLEGEATPLQAHVHQEIRAYGGDASVIHSFEQFGIEFAARLKCHGQSSSALSQVGQLER